MQQNWQILEHVPKHVLCIKQVCLAIVEHKNFVLCYVPLERYTKQLCLAAVKRDGLALQYVPDHLCTKQVCLAAVQQTSEALRLVPKHLYDNVKPAGLN